MNQQRSAWPAWTREPLVHFVLLGLAIVGLWSYLAPVRTEPIAAPTEEKMAELQAEYLRRFGRLPSNEEKHALWMDAVQQEVLFREGIALGLDAGDPIVKRRVVQKMGFMLDALATPGDPEETQLKEYFEQRRDKYQGNGTISFEQHFFDAARSGDAEGRARSGRLKVLDGGEVPQDSDPFPHGSVFTGVSGERVGSMFGAGFSDAVQTMEVGAWRAVESEFGWHLVHCTDRTLPSEVTFGKVRTQVLRDYVAMGREQGRQALVLDLMERHGVAMPEVVAP